MEIWLWLLKLTLWCLLSAAHKVKETPFLGPGSAMPANVWDIGGAGTLRWSGMMLDDIECRSLCCDIDPSNEMFIDVTVWFDSSTYKCS